MPQSLPKLVERLLGGRSGVELPVGVRVGERQERRRLAGHVADGGPAKYGEVGETRSVLMGVIMGIMVSECRFLNDPTGGRSRGVMEDGVGWKLEMVQSVIVCGG
jgi:hypothetical protein